ncbi:DUF3883 domain-containing protein [Shewanella septentrionalis]|uniref:DUF3883 domain-containing protein n=1 Tax=Shewanella septentrionalis TaxID=2952223 RepID=A0A9X3ASA5_9GAMM|nr:DUF3883 domain-containing protein [Shewanella septentrionalis]MCT7944161.1 DUF3883 domain-containing protein [Shewanella septentrionalis]
MTILTTPELAEKLAGGDSYIRTKDNVVKGLAITTELNPEAPEVIVVGNGPRIKANARLFLEQQEYVPVYLKQAVNAWKFLGKYKADRYSQDPKVIEQHRQHRPSEKVDGILFLSTEVSYDVEVTYPSFPAPEKRKKVELAAIEYVVTHYERQGYSVSDRQSDNCGYDLFVEKGKSVLKIEVKGTSFDEQRFFLSRNERAKSVDPLWRLAVVSSALDNPELSIYNTAEMEKTFGFEPLCWECRLPQT